MRVLVVLALLVAGCSTPPSKPPPVQQNVTVDWQPVTELTNGNPLTDLSGYLVSWHVPAGLVMQQHVVGSATQCVVQVPSGAWQFYVQAVSQQYGVGLSSQVIDKTVP